MTASQASPQRVDNSGIFGFPQQQYPQLALEGSNIDMDSGTGYPATGRGVHGVKSRAAQQKLRTQQQQPQQGSAALSANRMRTLTMSTPHLTDHPKHAHFNFVNHLATKDQTAHRASLSTMPMPMVPIAFVAATTAAAPGWPGGFNGAIMQLGPNGWQVSQPHLQPSPSSPARLQSATEWWGSKAKVSEEAPKTERIQSVELVRSSCRRDSGGVRKQLNTADSVFAAVTPPPH